MVLVCGILYLTTSCSTGKGIAIMDPMARPSPLEGGTGAAFMTIRNAGPQADRLRSATSPAARMVELHETVDDNGVMRMVPQPDGWELGPRGQLELKPGGKHMMLVDLVHPLKPGDIVVLTLNFDAAGPIEVQVPVENLTKVSTAGCNL